MKPKINSHFFDKETVRSLYVLGSFLRCYNPIENDGISFTSSSKELVDKINNLLEVRNKVISHPRNSYFFKVKKVPYIYNRLDDLGLNKPKNKRLPPPINNIFISDFNSANCSAISTK